MATQSVEFRAATGLTITAKLFSASSDTQVASVSATEATNRKGTYTAAFTDVAAGEYQLIAFDATPIPVASWWVTLTLTTATFGVYDKAGVVVMAANTLTASALAADAVTEIANAVTGGSGTGARTVTVTVNDSATAIQSATVRMTAGAETYTATTNVSGVAVFNLDDATYTVAITKSGYSYAGTTLVVDGDESVTYSMTVITITPSSGSLVTGYWTCYSELGAVESGVTVTLQAVRVPSESGLALDSAARTATSAANGVAQFTNLIPGATYRVKRGSGDYYTIKISDTATGTVVLNSILGT